MPSFYALLQTSVAAFGADFFKGASISTDHYFNLYECWSALKNGTQLKFVENGVEQILDVDHLFPFDGKCYRSYKHQMKSAEVSPL